MSIDHVSIPVTLANFEAEVNFLSAALEPLGIKEQMRVVPEAVGFGKSDTGPFLWVGAFTPDKKPISGIFAMHVALIARTRKEVDAFYETAIAAGGKDFGKPGLRPEYHEHYYGAFVISPSGHNIEAVVHTADA